MTQNERVCKHLEGLALTDEQAVKALDSIIAIKRNELLLEGHLYSGEKFDPNDIRYEYLALLKVRSLLVKDEPSCKSCDNFDLCTNTCLINGKKGYVNQICLHPNCANYKEGDWKPQAE